MPGNLCRTFAGSLAGKNLGPVVGRGGSMAESWFYMHEGKSYGPAPAAALRLLAAGGKLAPTDLVWAEGDSPLTAVLARPIIPFPQSAAPCGAVPDWLGDVR